MLALLREKKMHDLISGLVMIPGFVVEVLLMMTLDRGSSLHPTLMDLTDQILRTSGLYISRWMFTKSIGYAFVTFVGLVFLGFLVVQAVAFAVATCGCRCLSRPRLRIWSSALPLRH